MARSQSPPILGQLRNARTLPEQTVALRALKNEIVGHIQKKELWVGLGVLDPIVRTLASSRSPGKLNGKDARLPVVQRPLSEEEGVRLQALQLVASFANGMLPFLELHVVIIQDQHQLMFKQEVLHFWPLCMQRERYRPFSPMYLHSQMLLSLWSQHLEH